MKINHLAHAMTQKKVAQLPNGQFLLCLESHGSDDYYSTEHWSHYAIAANQFQFSANITIVAATQMCNAVAVVVEKKNPALPETLVIHDPDKGSVSFQF